MREHHRIVLTGKDIRNAFLKYFDNGEPGGYFPNDAKIYWVGPVDKFFDTDEVAVIYWGDEEKGA